MTSNFFLLIYRLADNTERRVLFEEIKPTLDFVVHLKQSKAFAPWDEINRAELLKVTSLNKDKYEEISREEGILLWPRPMRFYQLNSLFDFGEFSGKTLREVIEIYPSYLDWCAINISHFYIDPITVGWIKRDFPNFIFSEYAHQKCKEKVYARDNDQLYISGDKSVEWNEKEWEASLHDGHNYEPYEEDEPNIFHSRHYDDELDTNQQSPDFWDNL